MLLSSEDAFKTQRKAEPSINHLYFYSNSMKELAESVQRYTSGFSRIATCDWSCFEDGFPNITLDVKNLPGRHVVFFADLCNPADMFEQVSVLYALPRYFCKSLTVMLPFFPTGTMERVETEGQVATAHTLARILSGIPLSCEGPAKLVIYDIHTLQNRFYFGDYAVPVLETAMTELKKILALNHTGEELAIAFPDDGAYKRFSKLLKDDKIQHVVCAKVRDGDTRKVTIKDGDCKGKHVFIVDDLVRTGGTLKECRRACREAGAIKVSCFVTHAVFPPDEKTNTPTWTNFLPAQEEANGDKAFDVFYVTDSCPTMTKQLSGNKPFHVISLASSIANVISSSTRHMN
eukprot:TRINITY_DN5679_c0_g1_i1.p1 TRINITY_DN5679_c0_g1~~TRINITY_DN5679_c0_g1_i1.p1  ORF type:complete len:347 (-),score=59.49 TRINITY_DN5679_c0_g1_i1:35-1075(-)